jgi:hypothetical protein
MRFQRSGLVAAWVLTSLGGCGDSGVATDPTLNPTLNPTVVSDTPGPMTTSGEPTGSGQPTTSEPSGGNTLGTDSAETTNNPSTVDPSTDSTVDPSTDSTVDPSTDTSADTSTTNPDPSETDTDTGFVPCTEADCAQMGQYCDPDSGQCLPGCNEDLDCMAPTLCDVGEHTCKGCLVDVNCPLGTICEDGSCVPGCTDMQPCQDGLACCDGQCFDLLTDPDHCGSCSACVDPMNADASCNNGTCGLGACDNGFNDCDKDPNNGCEVNGTCECTPGEQVACYTGPAATENKGICKGGLQTCNAQGTGFGPCQGQVLPMPDDICSNGQDDNCNGQTDEDPDEDGDGWTKCGGDCCDFVGPACLNPELVNPGAFEVPGNMVDDDCDNNVDNLLPACDQGLASNSNTGNDYAKAIDLCQFTTENPPQNQKKWGVISTTITRADGAGAASGNAKSIRTGFGTGGIVPQKNSNLAVFSTGNAADQNDNNPGFFDFQTGNDNGANSAAPADWLAANGNQFPNAPGCPGPGSNTAFNSIMMKIRIRVPTNAKSFNVQMHFFSAEWPEYACTAFNDLFVTLIDSQGAGNPADKNIAIYTTPQMQKFPVGVNIAKAAPGLFTECQNGPAGCIGTQFNYNNCSAGVGPLAGTGFQVTNDAGCGANNTTGGGSGWLKMAGNVKGGETMEIRFAIWDVGDGVWDSLVLLDDWEWSLQASQPGVQPN